MDAAWLETFLQTRGMRAPAERDGVRIVGVPGATLRARVAGDGPVTLAIVPDPPNVIEHYDRLVDLLAPHVRVVCFEAPGFGFSAPGPGFDFSPGRQAATMASFLTRLGHGPYVLAFPCFAGLLAVRLAAERPDLVSHLVLVQTPSWDEELAWVGRIDRRRILQTPWVGQLATSLGKRAVARSWYRAALPPGADAAPFLGPALRAFDAGGCYCLASAFQAACRETDPGLRRVRQPALVVWGGADRTHRRTDKRSTLDYVPHADWVEFEAAGHFPDLEQPERFRDEVLHFLG
jgi:pimeloyl-ACP methyl ester carboxylesterase